jgi:hypothetical protein
LANEGRLNSVNDSAKWLGLASAVVISAGVVWSMAMLSGAIVRSRGADEMIRVTGSARKPIRSDFILWTGTVSYNAPTVAEAFTKLKAGTTETVAYLKSKGVADNEIVTNAIVTVPLTENVRRPDGAGGYSDRSVTTGYQLSQQVEVRSSKVDEVDRISREVTDLISRGIPFQSDRPQYIYTKLSEVKVEILAEAAADARRRAEEIAKSSGARLGGVRFARMSPLQITPLYSTEVSSEGQNDTTSIDKAITAIVTMGVGLQ